MRQCLISTKLHKVLEFAPDCDEAHAAPTLVNFHSGDTLPNIAAR